MYYLLYPFVFRQSYINKDEVYHTGEADSRNSGCFLCKRIPQKRHNGFEATLLKEGSKSDLRSLGKQGIANKVSGASSKVIRLQHLHNHKGVGGHICIDTLHLSSLCLWSPLSISLLFFLFCCVDLQKASSAEWKWTGAAQ